MGKQLPRRPVLIALIALTTACTVHQDKTPSLTGPSEFAQSVSITATPDSISQDGASQSSIVVVVRGPNGEGLSGVPLRMEIAVGGVIQDFGRLSAKNIVTDSNGRASAVYIAPPAPPRSSLGPNNIVTIIVTPTGSNFQTSIRQSVDIRLVRPGVILPPGATPNPAFTFRPDPASVNVATRFDASASCATSDPCSSTTGITSFEWNFGDGTTGTGQTTTKTFRTAGTYTVTLTLTNGLGLAASTTQQVTVVISDAPTAAFVFSPSSPAPGQEVQFNASTSQAVAGRTITRYSWNWGDGETATGRLQDHDFLTAGTFTVTLSVTDDAGQSATTSQSITVGTTPPTPPVASFTFGPPSPRATITSVTFDGSGSTGSNLTYTWNFGDGIIEGPFASSIRAHIYAAPGAYAATLRVTDTVTGLSNTSAPQTVTVVP